MCKATLPSEVEFAIEIGRKEDWGVVTHDSELFFSIDPDNSYIGELEGKQVAHVLALKYDRMEYCYIGMYIVKKEFRGKGYGRKTWDRAWSDIPDTCVVSLSTGLNTVSMYEKYGFKTAWNEFTYSYSAEKVATLPLPSSCSDLKLTSFREADFERLVEYDMSVFCYSREAWLTKMFDIPNCEGWVAANKDGEIVGYCIARVTLEKFGWWLVPMFAENISVAQALFVKVANYVKEQPIKKIVATVSEVNEQAMELFQASSPDFCMMETARVFARGCPKAIAENTKKRVFSRCFVFG